MKRIIAIALLLLLAACVRRVDREGTPQSTSTTNNQYEVVVLFEYDSCKVYRFSDNGRSRYFARCAKMDTITTSHIEDCGKNCTREVVVNTTETN